MKLSNAFSNNHVANLISHFSPMNLLPKLFTGKQRYHEGDSLIVVLNNHPQQQNREIIGSGTSVSNERLSSSLVVKVTKILPTGALFVSGKKWLTTRAENEYLYLLGIIHADDIGTNNDVSSQCISDVRVLYIGEDCLSESDRLAWTLRYFNSHWAPL